MTEGPSCRPAWLAAAYGSAPVPTQVGDTHADFAPADQRAHGAATSSSIPPAVLVALLRSAMTWPPPSL